MRYGKFLPENGTIGFIAPSFGCATEPYITCFDNAIKKFQEMGYGIDEGPNARAGLGIGISNTPEKCGQEINDYFLSEKNDVLISCGGGELMCEDLPYVDFDAIKKAPAKWFMGYSDNTNLTFLLPTLCDTAAIYGPCGPSFGMEPWHRSHFDAMRVLAGDNVPGCDKGSADGTYGKGSLSDEIETKCISVSGYDMWERESLKDEEHPLVPYNLTEKSVIKTYFPENIDIHGSFSGRLLGGCMDCLGNLVGTRFDKVADFNKRYAGDGVIWFLECCELNTVSMRRSIWQLDQAGWFENAKGFLIGRPFVFDEPMFGLDQYEAILGVLRKYKVPVIMDLDIGHLAPMMPLISGALANVNVSDNIRIDMELR